MGLTYCLTIIVLSSYFSEVKNNQVPWHTFFNFFLDFCRNSVNGPISCCWVFISPFPITILKLKRISNLWTAWFQELFKNGPIPASFCSFCHFLDTILIIQIEKSLDGGLGIRTWGCRMVGTDETTELLRPRISRTFITNTETMAQLGRYLFERSKFGFNDIGHFACIEFFTPIFFSHSSSFVSLVNLVVSNCDLNTINETAVITVERRLMPRREQVSGYSDTQGTSRKSVFFIFTHLHWKAPWINGKMTSVTHLSERD